MLENFFYFVIFLFGLIIGSFLNSFIYRLASPNNGEKKSSNRSYCPQCKHLLSWQDLIPVLSFVFLKGKCRYCQEPISFQYPLVEITTGILFVALAYNLELAIYSLENLLNIIYWFFLTSCLLVIFVYDLKHYIIPDKVIYPAILVSFIWYLLSAVFFDSHTWYEMLKIVYSAFGSGLFFLLIVLISRGRWMGVGDIKLAFLMGLVLSWPNILVALFLSFFIGSIIGMGLVVFGEKGLKSEVPFAPFLISGTFFALFWGSELVSWYQSLFLIQ